MGTDFLHGVEVLDIDNGDQPIRTVASSVIAIIGTAPNTLLAAYAKLVLGDETSNTGLVYTAITAGLVGNNYAVRYNNPGAASQDLSFSVESQPNGQTNGVVIVVNLATNESAAIITTAADIATAWAATDGLAAIIGCAALGTSNGSGVISPINTKYLSGGYDEPFPVNTPVLVPGDKKLAAKLSGIFGGGDDDGTLPSAMDDIFNQIGAVVVVVRVTKGVTDEATISNIIGGVDGDGNYTGMQAFLGAESLLGIVPRILIAPGWSSNQAVAAAMEIVANRLRAHCPIEGPDTTDDAATAYRHNFGSRRLYIVDPGVKEYDIDLFLNVLKPNSAYVAGLIARIDNEQGFWNSPSNQEIYGIVGTTRAVDFTLGDPASRANLLNAQDVATIIRKDGFRLWGNRTCSTDLRYAFLSVSRTCDMIDDSILRAHMWAVDRNITSQYVSSVVDNVNAYLKTLKNLGAIIDGKCWADADLNTPDNIANGQIYFDYDFAPPYPAERVTFRRRINNNYLVEIFK